MLGSALHNVTSSSHNTDSKDKQMPRASEAPETDRLCRLLLIGDGKIGKTPYAGLAGEQGFNVLYLDGDVGGPTIASLPAKAKENIYLMNVGDRFDGGAIGHQFVDFMVQFFSTPKVLWNDSEGKLLVRGTDTASLEVWELYPSKFDYTWVLVIDSWTSLVQSCMLWAARANGVDLANASLSQMREVYKASGMKLTQFLVIIQRIKCNVIVIAHPDEFVKLDKPEGVRIKDINEKDLKVAWTKMIPKSSSKPHALTMSKFFTDIAWMEANKAGTERRINMRLSDERVSGGHLNDMKTMQEFNFARLVKAVDGNVPTVNAPIEPALIIHSAGTYEAPSVVGKVLDGTKDSAVVVADTAPVPATPPKVGLAALMAANRPA